MTAGTLYIVATPIGNLNDITLRALEVLKDVDVIAAEDTRHSKKLMDHFAITTRLMAVHDHNEDQRIDTLKGILNEGRCVALISDAGTPLISDPGFRLVRALRQSGHTIISIPGPCAAVAALSVAGLATDCFLFVGFLSAKQQSRQSELERLIGESATLVFYESPKRIINAVTDVVAVMGGARQVAVAKELTKAFETVKTGTAESVLAWLQESPNHCRGEFVLMVEGACEAESDAVIEPKVLRSVAMANEYMPLKKACALVSEISGIPKNALYSAMIEQTKG